MGEMPDWVEKQKRKGCVVKHVGDRYYLYSNSSRRVPGKRYPQPVQKILGQITPEGLVVSLKVPFENSGIRVYEYGFSAAVITLWNRNREALSCYGMEVLESLIHKESPESWFLKDAESIKDVDIEECRTLIAELSNHTFEELKSLESIRMLQFNEETGIISYVDDGQRRLLDELDVDIYGDIALI